MQRIAISVDFSLTAITPFFKALMGDMRKSSEFVILASTAEEIGNRLDNYRYRARQLQKMGIDDFDFLVVADGEDVGQRKKDICEKLGVSLVFEDNDNDIRELKKVAKVLRFA